MSKPNTFDAPFEIIKADEDSEGNWYIEGFAATTDLDLHNDIIEQVAFKKAEEHLRKNATTVLFNHDPGFDIGRLVEVATKKEGWFVKVLISKTVPDIWKKLQEGVLNKFSIRARVLAFEKKFNSKLKIWVNHILELLPIELSVVSLPANQAAKVLSWYVSKSLEGFDNPEGKDFTLPMHCDLTKDLYTGEAPWGGERKLIKGISRDAVESLEGLPVIYKDKPVGFVKSAKLEDCVSCVAFISETENNVLFKCQLKELAIVLKGKAYFKQDDVIGLSFESASLEEDTICNVSFNDLFKEEITMTMEELIKHINDKLKELNESGEDEAIKKNLKAEILLSYAKLLEATEDQEDKPAYPITKGEDGKLKEYSYELKVDISKELKEKFDAFVESIKGFDFERKEKLIEAFKSAYGILDTKEETNDTSDNKTDPNPDAKKDVVGNQPNPKSNESEDVIKSVKESLDAMKEELLKAKEGENEVVEALTTKFDEFSKRIEVIENFTTGSTQTNDDKTKGNNEDEESTDWSGTIGAIHLK